KMKDSGIEWLGEIPEHWDVCRLKYLGRIRYGLGEPPAKKDEGLPFIRATDIYRGKIDPEAIQHVDPNDIPWSRASQLKARDILVVRSGAYTGDSAIIPEQWAGAIAGYDLVLTIQKAKPKFIAFALLSKYILQGQIYLAKMRAAQPHLNAEELGDCAFVLPPSWEQHSVARYLDRETNKIDGLIAKVQDSSDRLREYRSALISAAVTGKIDVRQEVVV
ncbi:MAG: restriction endonuclease subunit S, partial [Dehalococcoidia bacterium]|nr:restriction endonuclease subunit S [Dehalococcoidia bacterium]